MAGGFSGFAGGYLRLRPEEESLLPALSREELPEEEELLLMPLLPEAEGRVATLALPEDSEEERVETLLPEELPPVVSWRTVADVLGAVAVLVRDPE